MEEINYDLGKLKFFEIENIGIVSHVRVEINKPLILFVGDSDNGKTTMLNSFIMVCGGSFPPDILKHGTDVGYIKTSFQNAFIYREFYRSKKDGSVKSRPIKFIYKGIDVPSPKSILRSLLNPFDTDQDYFIKKTPAAKEKYFAEVFAIDTQELDKKIADSKDKASKLKIKISVYGAIDCTEVEPTDMKTFEIEKNVINQKYQDDLNARELANKGIKKHNDLIDTCNKELDNIVVKVEDNANKIKQLLADQEVLIKNKNITQDWLRVNFPLLETPQVPLPNLKEVDQKIINAMAKNATYNQYLKNLEKQKIKDADKVELTRIEYEGREAKKEKLAKLKIISDQCGVPGLIFGDIITYKGDSLENLSGSNEIVLSSALRNLYPKKLSVELVDKGESLGTKVADYVKKAKDNLTTIIMTVVSSNPAKSTDEIGVYVMKKGEIEE